MNKKQKVAFHTFGCKLNFSETSTISKMFSEQEFEVVDINADELDVVVINTCSVTNAAEKKSRQFINKINTKNPNATIAVVGCYSQLKPEEISKIEGVDLILGSNEKFRILEHLSNKKTGTETMVSCDYTKVSNFEPSYSLMGRTRSFLKIQDGCDYFCSYCTIPFARGRSRNEKIEKIVAQVHEIIDANCKEIILTGINIGDFGKSTGETFFELVKELDKVEGISRYRISSIEPNLITDEVLEFVSKSNSFLPHFHIPLQSGSDKVLKLMNRKYEREVFANRIAKIKQLMPLAGIGTDVIVGFPGETDEDFEDTYQFLEFTDVNFLHIFQYSERDNTRAIKLENPVQNRVRHERSKKLQILADKKQREFYEKNISQTAKVLFESETSKGKIYGFTENYLKVECDFKPELVNRIVDVKLCEIAENGNFLITFA